MLVTLMDGREMKSLSIPDKPAGRYWIDGYDDAGSVRKIMMLEPRDGAWLVRATRFAQLADQSASGTGKSELVLAQYASYPFTVFDANGSKVSATLLVEPNTDDRIEYHKVLAKSEAELTIGRSSGCDIRFDRGFVSASHAALVFRNGGWYVKDLGSSNGTYVNERCITGGSWCALKPGDVVFIVGLRIVAGSAFIALNSPDGMVSLRSEHLRQYVPQSVDPLPELEDWEVEDVGERAGFFFRSPRFRREVETKHIAVDAPPSMQSEAEMPLMQMIGPALVMGIAAMFSGIVMAYSTLESGGSMLTAAPMLVMSVSMIAGMAIFPVIARNSQRKKNANEERVRQERYLRYLAEVRDEISQERVFQKQVLLENHVTPEKCLKRALNGDRALWERTVDHDDFLELRLGLGTRPLDAEIDFPERHFELVDDNLQNAMYELMEAPTDLEDVPITVSVVKDRVSGIIGSREAVLQLVRNLIAQIVALHSYDEVKLVLLVSENERDIWNYARLFPHTWSDDQAERYFACGVAEAQELSIVLEKVIARRFEEHSQSSTPDSDEPAVPHYLVIAADKEIADRCGFVGTLLDGATDAGFSLITLFDSLSRIPKESSVVISMEEGNARIFDKDDTSGADLVFAPDEPISRANIVGMALALANTFMDFSTQQYELPAVLTFMQMYRAGRVEHLDILTRWKENDPTITLAAPVGVDVNGDLFNLDLHEKNHGPHGLVAGMTGSGKSEFIITLVLSLALNYSPEEIAFVLIDYKGGGLANAFDNERIRLPHLAGTITNLDGAAINRSLVSIEAELKRRQVMFNDARAAANEGTMDIYKYQQLYRQGLVSEPLPHLLVISDEFAELKMQQPEFMDQLVSTARIGRSLGVHLILATQKPSGVVNDQIWSNAKFKVCLKVQDRADSMDMIKRPEAAELVETGRFYLQVGFNEYFALGQSAWAGAPYAPTDHVREERDESIAVIDDLGHVLREARPQRKSDGGQGKQIVQVIDYICDSAASVGVMARPLWLDPIPALIYVDDLTAKYEWSPAGKGVIEAVVGEYDDPARQEQNVLTVNFAEIGNLVVYGASGGGKSTLIEALVYSLIRSYAPNEVNLYLLDYGTESLRAFSDAPHVGDVVCAGDDEKTANLFTLVEDEMNSRRRVFGPYGGDYATYVRSADDPVPAMVVIIEGLAAFFELHDEMRDRLLRLTRDGAKYGIYFVVTAESTSVVGFRMAQNFGCSLALRMNDESEYSNVMGVGRVKLLSEAYGAGLVRLHEVLQFQTAHACSGGSSSVEAIRMFCRKEFKGYSGPQARAIPVLPDEVSARYLMGCGVGSPYVPFGVGVSSLEPVSLDVLATPLTVISSDDTDSLESFTRELVSYLESSKAFELSVLDPEGMLESMSKQGCSLYQGVDQAKSALLEYARNAGKQPQLCVAIGIADLLSEFEYEEKREVEDYFTRISKHDASYMIIDRNASLGVIRYDPWLSALLSGSGVWLGSGLTEQSLIKPASFSSELLQPLEEGFGYVLDRGKAVLCKMMQDSAGENGGATREG